jgi:hypothetical protein
MEGLGVHTSQGEVLLGLAILDAWHKEGKTWSMLGAYEEDEEQRR